jgi:hypothetical protein
MSAFQDDNAIKDLKKYSWNGKKDSWPHAKKYFESTARGMNAYSLLEHHFGLGGSHHAQG